MQILNTQHVDNHSMYVEMIYMLTAFLPDIGVNELMTGGGGVFSSVMKVLEHSCITSQLPPHHPHANSDPILTATHSEYSLAMSRQSYNVTACVWVQGELVDYLDDYSVTRMF